MCAETKAGSLDRLYLEFCKERGIILDSLEDVSRAPVHTVICGSDVPDGMSRP